MIRCNVIATLKDFLVIFIVKHNCFLKHESIKNEEKNNYLDK